MEAASASHLVGPVNGVAHLVRPARLDQLNTVTWAVGMASRHRFAVRVEVSAGTILMDHVDDNSEVRITALRSSELVEIDLKDSAGNTFAYTI